VRSDRFAGCNAEVQWNLGLDFLLQNSTNICKNLNSLQLSVSDMVTRVNFPTFATADRRYCGLIRVRLCWVRSTFLSLRLTIRSVVPMFRCLLFCLLDTSASPRKTAKSIEVPFGISARVGPMNHVLDEAWIPEGKR